LVVTERKKIWVVGLSGFAKTTGRGVMREDTHPSFAMRETQSMNRGIGERRPSKSKERPQRTEQHDTEEAKQSKAVSNAPAPPNHREMSQNVSI